MEFALGMKLYGEEKKFVMKRHYWAWTLSGYFFVIFLHCRTCLNLRFVTLNMFYLPFFFILWTLILYSLC